MEHCDCNGYSVVICLAKRLFYKNRRVVQRIDTTLYCACPKGYGNRLEHCVYRQHSHNRSPYIPPETYYNHIAVGNTWYFEYYLVYAILCPIASFVILIIACALIFAVFIMTIRRDTIAMILLEPLFAWYVYLAIVNYYIFIHN